MATHVTSKGQVTIPKPVRAMMGITTGSAVEFTLAQDVLVAESFFIRCHFFIYSWSRRLQLLLFHSTRSA